MESNMKVDNFLSDLSKIEQELNSKCADLIDSILEKSKQMKKRITVIRQRFLSVVDSEYRNLYKAHLNFDIESIFIAINMTMNIEINIIKDSLVLSKIPKPAPFVHEEFRLPKELVIDNNSGNIYVASSGNECVKECNSTGTGIDSFGYGELKEPYGLILHSSMLYVSDVSLNSIFVYDINNKKLKKQVPTAYGDHEVLNQPKGMAIDQDQFIYVCDYGNDRILVYNTSLKLIKGLTWDTIKLPVNVEFSENRMYVLCDSDPCLFVLEQNGKLTSHFPSNFQSRIFSTGFFCIDEKGRILISSYGGFIYIFDNNGQYPNMCDELGKTLSSAKIFYGLKVNLNGKVVVVSSNPSKISFF